MPGKLKIVISDLHIGAGPGAEGENPLDDFNCDADLIRFLHAFRLESINEGREVELIINGDLFEFLQVPAVDAFEPGHRYDRDSYHDSSEAASIRRLELIAAGHPAIFEALSDFIHVEPPKRRITIIKGNRDVNLYWPRVKSKLREILGATGARADALVFAEEFISREGLYVEHGHQRTEAANRFPDFIDPRLKPNQPDKLYYPPGSWFTLDVLNEMKRENRWVDRIKPLSQLIWHCLAWDFSLAVEVLAAMVAQLPALLAKEIAPADRLPADPQPDFLEPLQTAAGRAALAQQYRADDGFRWQFHHQIQTWLAGIGLAPPAALMTTIDAFDDPLEIASAEQRAWQRLLSTEAQVIARREKAQVVLFGHIHVPVQQMLEGGSLYLNTGCWLWPGDLPSGADGVALVAFNQARGRQRAYRLPYARIDYDDDGNPQAQLLDFAAKGRAGDRGLAGFYARLRTRIRRWLEVE
ncbi:MAG: hypothetical protein ACE5H9_17915 [Anaerolineae bacterium]